MGSENTGKEIHMLKIGKIHEGFVLDHIKAGKIIICSSTKKTVQLQ